MNWAPPLLLVGAVAAVGVLHTMVPDHWVPIVLLARQRGWSKAETARAAMQAGAGHVVSTLLIAGAVWLAGIAFAARFGRVVDVASSVALIAFGGWIAISAWRELPPGHRHEHGHAHRLGDPDPHSHSHSHSHSHRAVDEREDWAPPDDDAAPHIHDPAPATDPLYAPLRGETAVLTRHAHAHRHGRGPAHRHWHDHTPATAHPVIGAFGTEPPLHRHRHKTQARTALLLILGSSPMVEGIPAFFAAAKYGAGLISAMAAVFVLSTIATYVVLCASTTAGLRRLQFGALERYGEVLSGGVIAALGAAFAVWSVL